MTAQECEVLYYKRKKTWMASEPLNDYLESREDIEFIPDSTACWRGYYGKWKIAQKKLYLIDLKAYIEGIEGMELVGIDYLFPGQVKVFANWFTGEIRIPQGEMIQYIHMGYESIYEGELILNFKEGVVIEEQLISNL